MPSPVLLDAILIVTHILTQIWVVVGVSVLLERQRQRRLPHYISRMKAPPPLRRTRRRQRPIRTSAGKTAVALFSDASVLSDALRDTQPTTAADRQWQLPVRAPEPEKVVIQIEPDVTDSQETRSIRRLIAHLQSRDAQQPAS